MKRPIGILMFVLSVTLLIGACGSGGGEKGVVTKEKERSIEDPGFVKSSDIKGARVSAEEPSEPGDVVKVRISEYQILVEPEEVAAGTITFAIDHEGKDQHDVVIMQTTTSPDELPLEKGKLVLDSVIGEVQDIVPGARTAYLTIDAVKNGGVVLVDPDDYQAGMYAQVDTR